MIVDLELAAGDFLDAVEKANKWDLVELRNRMLRAASDLSTNQEKRTLGKAMVKFLNNQIARF